MSIENRVFNLLHSSGVLCVKQVATYVIIRESGIRVKKNRIFGRAFRFQSLLTVRIPCGVW